MDGNSTCSPSDRSVIIEGYARGLYSTYVLLIIPIIFASTLVPVLLALSYFSTWRQKRTPLFICVVLSVVFSILQCTVHAGYQLRGLLSPLQMSSIVTTSVIQAIMFLDEMPNFVADIALLLRMLAVYPYSSTPRLKFVALFSLPLCFKVVRLLAMGETMYYAGQEMVNAGTSLTLAAQSQAWVVVGRVFDAVDNIYASTFFIWKLRSAFLPRHTHGRVSSGPFSHVRALAWFAMSSFIIPVSLLIAEVALAASSLTQSAAFTGLQVSLGFTSAICIAFATVWASATQDTEQDTALSSPLPFAAHYPSKGRSSGASQTTQESGGDAAPLPLKSHAPHAPIRVRVDMSQESEV